MGIDFGSKLAGTTVIASYDKAQISLVQAEKKKDADSFLLQQLSLLSPGIIAFDAPLSLPGVYTAISACNDYHYRQADKTLGAMSPMFLGGLTARAMKICSGFRQNGWQVYETYPAATAKHSQWKSAYAKTDPTSLPNLFALLKEEFTAQGIPITGWKTCLPLKNYHQADALIALLTAIKIGRKQATEISGIDGNIWI